MDGSSNTPVYNGEQPTKPPHVFSAPTTAALLAQERLNSYMGTYNGGGDPVTALGVRSTTAASSVEKRLTKVSQCLRENVTKFE
ncbi:hypothetical protein F5B17DRAFT_398246 [Nemania serpens]|nr:hypothetical protein F5B17DRAFT_398246 [Nemania serpens]